MENDYKIQALNEWLESDDGVTVDALQYCLSRVVSEIEVCREIGDLIRKSKLEDLSGAMRNQLAVLVGRGTPGEHVPSESIALELGVGTRVIKNVEGEEAGCLAEGAEERDQVYPLNEHEKNRLIKHLEVSKASVIFDKAQ